MATYYSIRDGLITDTSIYGRSIPSMERITNTSAYTLATSDSWSVVFTGQTTDVVDSIAVNLSGRSSTPVGTLTLQVSSRTVLPTTVGTYPISSFASYNGSNNTITTYPLNWQLLKLSSSFINSTGTFRINLKTSNANQLTLMGLSASNGVDYNRMAITNKTVLTAAGLTLTNASVVSVSPLSNETTSLSVNGNGRAYLGMSVIFTPRQKFTIEGWWYISSSTTAVEAGLIAFLGNDIAAVNSQDGWALTYTKATSAVQFKLYTNGTGRISIPGVAITVDQWNHIAVSSDGTTFRLFINGVSSSTGDANFNSGNMDYGYPAFYLGTLSNFFGATKLNGMISNVRVVKDICLYQNNFIVPNTALSDSFDGVGSTVILYKQPYNNIYIYNEPGTDIHISSALNNFVNNTTTITADNFLASNLFVHNNSVLKFPINAPTTLNVVGPSGIQVTSDGVVEIGSSQNNINANTVHRILLSDNHIGVSNGGILDVYGAYKVPYTKLATPSLSATRTFTVVDDVSSNWQVNDTLVFIPNTTQPTSYDVLTLSSFDSNSAFRTATSAVFAHTLLEYVPNVANLTRNVKINSPSLISNSLIRAADAAKVRLNNVEFKCSNVVLRTNVNSNGLVAIQGCALSGTGTETLVTPAITKHAAVFNGTNSYITTPTNNTDFNIGANTDFTVECFFKLNNLVYQPIFRIGNIKNDIIGDVAMVFIITTVDGGGVFAIGGPNLDGSHNGQRIVIPMSRFKVNEWQHFAAVGKDGNVAIYLDGNLYGSIPRVNFYFSSTFLAVIGQYNSITGDVDSFYNGRLTDFRFVKGRAIYTGNRFTPPFNPLTEITDTNVSTAILLTLRNGVPVDISYRKASLNSFNMTAQLDSPFIEDVFNADVNNTVSFRSKSGILFNNINSNNNTVTNNLLLSSKDGGIYVNNGLTGNLIFNGNVAVGPSPYGSYVTNNTTGLALSGIVNYNNTIGMIVSGDHVGRIDSVINTHNSTVGVLVDGTMPQLAQTVFTNITASNNRTLGFAVSGNANNLFSPITLNINRLVANNNLSGGFEAYCISGNLSSLELNHNGLYGMKISIGNAPLIIDGIAALMPNVSSVSAAIGILSGVNYFPIVIKNANLGKTVATSTFGSAIMLDSTKFLEFVVMNSTLSGGTRDFDIRTTRNLLEGSYLFNNTNVSPLPLGTGISRFNYQTDVFKTAGFAFTNVNNATGYNVAYFAAGNRLGDYTITYNVNETTSPSERLTPQSATVKLRSGSKFVALSGGEFTTVSVFVRKSSLDANGVAYNGNPPRLILKRNGAMGIDKDIVLTQLVGASNRFAKLTGVTPIVTDTGVLEFYVDCDGTQGWINIDNWTSN